MKQFLIAINKWALPTSEEQQTYFRIGWVFLLLFKAILFCSAFPFSVVPVSLSSMPKGLGRNLNLLNSYSEYF